MQIFEKRLTEIKPYEKNPRRNDQAVQYVKASIEQFGFKVPIVIDAEGVIVAGHTRYKAAKSLKMKTVPCIIADDLNEEQIKAFRLADNKVSEAAEWDFDLLNIEIAEIDTIEMADFGFSNLHEWFESGDKGEAREGEDEYQAFLDKFEEKHTTDDCYTPENIYNVICDYVEKRYNKQRKNFVRPFYPGGDYLAQKYGKNDVVVDNPPFSIMADILKYYIENDIPFFLFCNGLTEFTTASAGACVLCIGADLIYENGATVHTSFVTNMEAARFRTDPELYNALADANAENWGKIHKALPKYDYPPEVVTAAMLNTLCSHGVALEVRAQETKMIRELDAMKEQGTQIFGAGYLISEQAAKRKQEAIETAEKREKSECVRKVWELSEREKEIVRQLGEGAQ